MAELSSRWGVTPNTVSRRLAFLGIKPIRQGNFRFLTAEQLELAEQLHQHILSGKPQDAFPRPDQPEGGQVVRRVAASVAPQVEQVQQLAALMQAMQPQVDPLQRARGLREAADDGLVLTSADLSALLGKGVSSWEDGTERFGYRFHRHQQGRQVLWTVERAITTTGRPALSAAAGGKGKRVGFATPDVIEAQVQVLSPAAALFAANVIS